MNVYLFFKSATILKQQKNNTLVLIVMNRSEQFTSSSSDLYLDVYGLLSSCFANGGNLPVVGFGVVDWPA